MSAWQDIRTMRAQPPPRVKGERWVVFSSALQQAEQLMRAAADTGPAARPLPLFYALSQAGRAIACARLRESWKLAGHGLTMPAKDTSKSLLRRVVKLDEKEPPEDRRHSFAGVAEATGSPVLGSTIELGAVWAGIPDLIEPLPQIPLEDVWPRPLPVHLTEWWTSAMPVTAQMPFELLVDGLPDDRRGRAPRCRTRLARDPRPAARALLAARERGAARAVPSQARGQAREVGRR